MVDTTPNFALPYPESTDPVEIWTYFQDLAEAVDTLVKTQTTDFYADMVPVQDSNGDNNGSPTAVTTTPNNGSTVCGVQFVAPPSGRVWIHFNAVFQAAAGTGQLYMGPQVRTGSSIGAGIVTYNPSSDPGCKVGGNTTNIIAAGASVLVSSLTPGDVYNVAVTFFAISPSGLTINYFSRQVSAEPAF
jgi:hypothetical protein